MVNIDEQSAKLMDQLNTMQLELQEEEKVFEASKQVVGCFLVIVIEYILLNVFRMSLTKYSRSKQAHNPNS